MFVFRLRQKCFMIEIFKNGKKINASVKHLKEKKCYSPTAGTCCFFNTF